MDNSLLDKPTEKAKRPYWAITSLVSGLLGTFSMIYFSYRMLLSFKGIQDGGASSDPNSFYNMKEVLLGSGLAIFGLYLLSLFALIGSWVKEKSSIPRIFAIVGHAFIFISIIAGVIKEQM